MQKRIRRFESIMWVMIKLTLYISMMAIFILTLGYENKGLIRVSRTMGITFSTYIIVGLLFLSIYGKYDVGRRKSKPIIYSMSLAVVFTDLITYAQLMVMKTNTPSVSAFRFYSVGNLLLAILIQILVITIFAYAGNALFFRLHEPEKCHVVTSSQESLEQIIRGIRRYAKQYAIEKVHNYRKPELLQDLQGAQTVFLYDIPSQKRSEIVSYCYKTRKNVYFNPEIEDIVEMSSEYYLLDDISVINYNVRGLTMEQRIIKRCMDIVISFIMIVLSAPIWIISALAIKLYDGGPVFFKQDRATIHEKVFAVYKFRTMKEHVENRSVTDGDDRITGPGKILRKFRLDELPQLLNVLKGDMSLVGPRPEMMENVAEYTKTLPEFQYRLRVKAGITGYAQIAGKYNTTPKDKLMMDLLYIERYSVFRDVQLLFQTAIVFLKSDSTEAFHKKTENTQYVFPEVEEHKE